MDTMTYRSVKGAGLTDDEIDTNFRLCFEKIAGVGLDGSFDVDPVTGGFLLGLTDGGSIGPIVVPAQPSASRGAWLLGRVYEPAEFFTYEGGLWQAVKRHQAVDVEDDVAAGNVRHVYTAPTTTAPGDGSGDGGGGSGDGWIYHTVSLTPGPKSNGLTYGQLLHHEATVFNPDVRVLVSSKAVEEGNAQVMVYCGQDILLGFKLDGSDATKLPGDYVVPANTPLDVKMFGGSPNLSDVFTIRLAVRPAA